MNIDLSPIACLCLILAGFLLAILFTISLTVGAINYLNRLDIKRCARIAAARKPEPPLPD